MNTRTLLEHCLRQMRMVDEMIEDGDLDADMIQHVMQATNGFVCHWLSKERGARKTTLQGRVLRRAASPLVRSFVLARDGGTCAVCRKAVAPVDVHLDHHIPVAHGGTEEPDNLRVTHARCNLEKGAKLQ